MRPLTAGYTYQQLKWLIKCSNDYKKKDRQGRFCGHDRRTLSTRVELSVARCLIVDEAQDLVPLQWRWCMSNEAQGQAHILCWR